MSKLQAPGVSSRLQLIAAFAAIYIIWGSTYLAIRFAIETLPPLLMAGTRFFVAGALLYTWARAQGATRPVGTHWRAALIVGGLLLFSGNGLVVWAEQKLPSSLAALLIALVPLWMVLLDWLWRGAARPTLGVTLGLLLGLAGIVVLVGPDSLNGSGAIDLVSAGLILVAGLSWAAGSLYSRSARLPASPLLATALEMLVGGVLLLSAGLLAGEGAHLNLAGASLRSLLALGYLIVFGSLVAFTAYVWLLRVVPSARVATYAYVNPVVAVFLGWALADEPLTPRTLLAAAIIVAAVVIIVMNQARRATHPAPESDPAPLPAAPAPAIYPARPVPPPEVRRGKV